MRVKEAARLSSIVAQLTSLQVSTMFLQQYVSVFVLFVYVFCVFGVFNV